MSNPVGKVSINLRNEPVKVGEMTINDDGTLEGSLLEDTGRAVIALIRQDPRLISFSVYAHGIGNAE